MVLVDQFARNRESYEISKLGKLKGGQWDLNFASVKKRGQQDLEVEQ